MILILIKTFNIFQKLEDDFKREDTERANYFQNIQNSLNNHHSNTLSFNHHHQHHHHHNNGNSTLSPKSSASNAYYLTNQQQPSHQSIYMTSSQLSTPSVGGSSTIVANTQQYFYNGGINSNVYLNTLNQKQQLSPQQLQSKQMNESLSPPQSTYATVYVSSSNIPSSPNSSNIPAHLISSNETYLNQQQNNYTTINRKANEF
jgi:hypothetical protein